MSDETLLGDVLGAWRKARLPPTEVAAILKTRGDVREARGDLRGALSDFSEVSTSRRCAGIHNDRVERASNRRFNLHLRSE